MWSRDSHFLRSLYFIDIGSDRFCAGKLKISANYSLKEKISLKLEIGKLVTGEIHTSKAYQSNERDKGYYKVDAEDSLYVSMGHIMWKWPVPLAVHNNPASQRDGRASCRERV